MIDDTLRGVWVGTHIYTGLSHLWARCSAGGITKVWPVLGSMGGFFAISSNGV